MAIESLLQQFELFGVNLGLDRIRHLLADLGNPHDRVPVIHVAGSNGKGSVCAYLSAVLTEAGYRVGRYTSPHLISWNERICINEEPIAPDTLEAVLHQVIATIDPNQPSPTQFEVITAAAWLYFAQQRVDVAVVEVGLGGRLDATNVCDRPLASVIVSISREHWQRLGPTLADIAGEKAGILKPGCASVIGQLPPEARDVVDRRIADLGCPVVYPQVAQRVDGEWQTGDSHSPTTHSLPLASYQGIRYPLPLQGEIQLHNSALAIASLQLLRQQGWQISDEQIANGMAKTRWTGRLQWFTWNGQTILIDGAHNPASAEVLRRFVNEEIANGLGVKGKGKSELKTPFAPISHPSSFPTHWVMGMLSTKDHADVFKALLREGDRLYLVPVPNHSTADPDQLAKLAWQTCPTLGNCEMFDDVLTALEVAVNSAQKSSSLTVLCGSLYLLGHFLKLVQPTNS